MSEQPIVAAAQDFHDTRPADARAKANGPWGSGQGLLDDSHARKHVSDAAWEAYSAQWPVANMAQNAMSVEKAGCVLITTAEHDALTANRSNSSAAADAKRIAALEAECESLSRQLRSREINAEPVVTRPSWRWSPLL